VTSSLEINASDKIMFLDTPVVKQKLHMIFIVSVNKHCRPISFVNFSLQVLAKN